MICRRVNPPRGKDAQRKSGSSYRTAVAAGSQTENYITSFRFIQTWGLMGPREGLCRSLSSSVLLKVWSAATPGRSDRSAIISYRCIAVSLDGVVPLTVFGETHSQSPSNQLQSDCSNRPKQIIGFSTLIKGSDFDGTTLLRLRVSRGRIIFVSKWMQPRPGKRNCYSPGDMSSNLE